MTTWHISTMLTNQWNNWITWIEITFSIGRRSVKFQLFKTNDGSHKTEFNQLNCSKIQWANQFNSICNSSSGNLGKTRPHFVEGRSRLRRQRPDVRRLPLRQTQTSKGLHTTKIRIKTLEIISKWNKQFQWQIKWIFEGQFDIILLILQDEWRILIGGSHMMQWLFTCRNQTALKRWENIDGSFYKPELMKSSLSILMK